MPLEICIDSLNSAVAAQAGGADRVELCSALLEGGLTPSAGLVRAVRRSIQIGLHVMIRPRGGDFLYSPEEFAIMREDIALARDSGADGVVLGLLLPDGQVDSGRTRELVLAAHPMQVTFHRAIDVSRNLPESLESIIATGATRILTSGAASNALEGSAQIAQLVALAADRIQIMVAGGVRASNAGQLIRETGATHFHAALRTQVPSPMTFRNPAISFSPPGSDDHIRHIVREEDVRDLRQAIDNALPENI